VDARAAVREALERGERAALVTVTGLEGNPPSSEGMALGVLEGGARFGSLGCDGFDESGEHDAMRALRERVRLERTYDWDETARIRVEVRPFVPGETVPGSTARPELIVIGTGPVARALAAIGKVLGFTIRAVSIGPSDAPDPDERIVVRSATELTRLRLGTESYVVIAGHDREFSQPPAHRRSARRPSRRRGLRTLTRARAHPGWSRPRSPDAGGDRARRDRARGRGAKGTIGDASRLTTAARVDSLWVW
jgi:xanthine/CO dehydrogenase XdhC/CoxF family maturation factor